MYIEFINLSKRKIVQILNEVGYFQGESGKDNIIIRFEIFPSKKSETNFQF